MLDVCESDIDRIEKQIASLQDIEATVKSRKKAIKSSIDVLEQIIQEGTISDADLRLLVEQIEISEKNGKLDVYVTLNGNFRQRIDLYKDGKIDDSYMECWYTDDRWQAS